MSTKELRNAAFAIGFGFTMGKFAADVTVKCVSKAYYAVMKEAVKFYANKVINECGRFAKSMALTMKSEMKIRQLIK